MSSVRNMSFDQFADKFTHDTEHILEFVGNLGHGRTERRSLQVYALRKLVEKHARKAGIDLQPHGKLNINFIIGKNDFFNYLKLILIFRGDQFRTLRLSTDCRGRS